MDAAIGDPFNPGLTCRRDMDVKSLKGSKIGIVGAGRVGKALLQRVQGPHLRHLEIQVLGVVDRKTSAPGFRYAVQSGCFTSRNYQDLFGLPGLEIIVELTGEEKVAAALRADLPGGVRLIDHHQAMLLYDFLRIEEERVRHAALLEDGGSDLQRTRRVFERFSKRIEKILEKRTAHLEKLERKLLDREQILSQIIDGSTIPTFVINKAHRVTHWNKACEKLTGYPAKKIVGTNRHWSPFRKRKRPLMADVIVDEMGEEQIEKYYGKRWKKSPLIDGAYEAEEFFPHFGKWLFFTAAPLRDPSGAIVGAIETLWDRTDRIRAKEALIRFNRKLAVKTEALLESERMMTQIIQGSTIPTFVIDKNHILTHWNKALEKLSGYQAEEMIGTRRQWEPFWDQERPSMADVVLQRSPESRIKAFYGKSWRRSALIEGAYEAEIFFPKLGVDGKWCYFTAAPIKGPDGSLIGAVETLWDTSEQKRAKEKLEHYANRLEEMVKTATDEIARRSDFQDKLIRSSNDGIVATDEKGKVIIYNTGAQKIFGYSVEEILNRASIETLYPPVVSSQVRSGLERPGDLALSRWTEVGIRSKGGETVPARFSGAILFQDTAVIGSVCFFRDLREIKRLQKELIKSERLAAIGQTIAGLAHSIKNILYGLKGGVYVLNLAMEKEDTEKIKGGWGMIQRNIERISELVMDLLMYSKERTPEPENCFPNAVVEEVCALTADLAAGHNIAVLQNLDADIKEVYMDSRAIHRILLDLVNNAIDACLFDILQEKKWTVSVSTALLKNDILQFQVTDNGVGMDRETLENLFTRLYSSKGQKGTGLGLLVSEKLVKENGGTIYVTSELGKGSTFTVHLPFQRPVRKHKLES